MIKRIVFTFGVGLFSLQAFCFTQNIFDINGLSWDTNCRPPVVLQYDPNPIPGLEIDYSPFNTGGGVSSMPSEINNLSLLHYWNAFGPVLDPDLLYRVQGKLLITGGHGVKEHLLAQFLDSPVEEIVITGAHQINGSHIGLIRKLVIEKRKTLTFTGTDLVTDPESYSRVTFSPSFGERENNLIKTHAEIRSGGVFKVWDDLTT